MTASEFFSGPLAEAIGWALLHLLWQGAIVAAILAAILALLTRRSANVRYLTSCAALTLLLLLAIATGIRSYEPRTESLDTTTVAAVAIDLEATNGAAAAPLPAIDRFALIAAAARDQLPMIVVIWLSGVVLLSARLLLSWARVHQLTTHQTRVADAKWQNAAARLADDLRLRRAVRVLESALVEVPTVVGWMRPVILFPAATLTGLTPGQIEMILAHELAHIRRHDFFINLLQAVAETLMFYHPAVWWMSRRIRIERENCCDDLAVAVCGNPLQYARALTRLEELRAEDPYPAVAASGGSLVERIRRLAHSRPEMTFGASRWTAALGVLSILAVLVIAPSRPLLAGDDEKKEKSAEKPASASVEVVAPEAGDDDDPFEYQGEPVAAVEAISPIPPIAGVPHPAPAPYPVIAPSPMTPMGLAGAIASGVAGGVAGGVAAGVAGGVMGGVPVIAELNYDFDVDTDVNVDVDYEEKSSEKPMGASGKLEIDELIALRSQGVTAEYIEEMRGAGLGTLTLRDIISLKIHGVTSAYIKQMRDTGIGPLTSVKEVLSLKIHGVDSSYIQEMRGAGLGPLSVKDISSLKIHGVGVLYVEKMRATLGTMTLKDVLTMKIHGVTPAYIEEMRGAGLGDLKTKDIGSLKIHGVKVEYIRAMREAGLKIDSARDILALAIHGVKPAFVKQLSDAGYKDLTPEQVAKMAAHGIDANFIREMQKYRDQPKK